MCWKRMSPVFNSQEAFTKALDGIRFCKQELMHQTLDDLNQKNN